MPVLYSSTLTADSQYSDLVDCSALYGVTKLRVTVDRGSARVYCGPSPDALTVLRDCQVGVTDIRLPLLPYVSVTRLSGNSSAIKVEVLGPEASELPLTSAYSGPEDGTAPDTLTGPLQRVKITGSLSTTQAQTATAAGTYRKARVSWLSNGAAGSPKLRIAANADNAVHGLVVGQSAKRRDYEMNLGDGVMLVCDVPITSLTFSADSSVATSTHQLLVTFGN